MHIDINNIFLWKLLFSKTKKFSEKSIIALHFCKSHLIPDFWSFVSAHFDEIKIWIIDLGMTMNGPQCKEEVIVN